MGFANAPLFPQTNANKYYEYYEQRKKNAKNWIRPKTQNRRDHIPGLLRATRSAREAGGSRHQLNAAAKRSAKKTEAFAQKQNVCSEKSRGQTHKIRDSREESATPATADPGARARKPSCAAIPLPCQQYRQHM